MTGRPKTVSVVIPILNSVKFLPACLGSVVSAMGHYVWTELILMDNGSSDGSYEMILSSYAHIAKIEQMKGVTISTLRNRGAQLGSGEYLCFIDSDCVVPEDYFTRVVETFEAVDADASGCMYDLPPLPHWIEKTWQDLHESPEDGYVHFLNSGNFVVKKSVFQKSGGFEETLVTGEDAEYCQRLIAAGFRIYQARAIRAMHLGNPKSLRAFFSKHTWHGLGMFGTFRHSWLDKPVFMTFLFLGSCAVGIAGLFLGGLNVTARIAVLVFSSLPAPVLTVIYRAIRTGALRRPIRSVLLYWFYYASRSYALLSLVLGRGKRQYNVSHVVR
jgi:glycosyltransferase involved in cell wall biosynthesis